VTAGDHTGDVVVLRALGLGDLLAGVPALRAVRRHFAAGLVTLCTNRHLVPLAILADVADAVLPVEPFSLGPLPPLPCDVAVNLHGRGPQSTRRLLERKPQRLLAFRHPGIPETDGGPAWRDDEHEVTRWCRLLHAHGIASSPGDLHLAPPDMAPRVAAATVIHPGAAAGARRWPAARFADVARRLHASGHRVVVTGGAAESALTLDICSLAGLPRGANLAGATDVLALAALVSDARLVVSGDTGVAHLATAYERPSVVLFGPTSPARWGPPVRPWHRVLWAGTKGDAHGAEIDHGLTSITVESVMQAVQEALSAHSVSH
jgi:hypothetical protein